MTSKAALFALLTMWGVGGAMALPAFAEEPAIELDVDGDGDAEPTLTNRVWVRSEENPGLPGSMLIFLSDGTLVQDSCWETHRLSPWEMTGAKSVQWDEDGTKIDADITSLTAEALVLTLKLKGGESQEQHFAPAAVPYLCPDMPKG